MNNRSAMPSPYEVRIHWASYLVECGKFDSIEEVMEEDYCFACGMYYRSEPGKRNTERCHITARCNGGSDDMSNIHNLCSRCHRASEALEGERYWEWFRTRTAWDALFQ